MQINTLVIFLLVSIIAPVFIGTQAFSQTDNKKVENWKLDSLLFEKTSNNGDLLVQLKSSLTHDRYNFPLEIVFLNSTLPTHTSQSVPNLESNNTGDTFSSTGLSVPSSLERVVPIQSYDIIIYDANGNEIWKKTSQTATEGRATQNVEFGDYNGKLTIVIDKIKLSQTSNNILNTDLPERIENADNQSNVDQSSRSDSVNFTSSLTKA
ncbi:MAG TPA: hypothetical protein VJU85_06755 [Nitrososphaeraceae archaeon]|nr:hypothetical protein [Nitrososphaeraceae archaeon]